MLTFSKSILPSIAAISMIALSACATQAPRVNNAALGYSVTNYAIDADGNEISLSNALTLSLSTIGLLTQLPAKANVTIDAVRYNSPFIGFFYGGQHFASLSVTLTDSSGTTITSFQLYVASSGERNSADAELASEAAQIIAAKAANAYLPMKARSYSAPKPVIAAATIPVVLQPAVQAPIIDATAPGTDDETPCVIGPDGKCLAF